MGAHRCSGAGRCLSTIKDDECNDAAGDDNGDAARDDPRPEQAPRVSVLDRASAVLLVPVCSRPLGRSTGRVFAFGPERVEGVDVGPGDRVSVCLSVLVAAYDLAGESDLDGRADTLHVGEIGGLEDVRAAPVIDVQAFAVFRVVNACAGHRQDALIALDSCADVGTRVVDGYQVLGAVEAGGSTVALHGESHVESVMLVDVELEGACGTS